MSAVATLAPGRGDRFGAHVVDGGVEFAVFSQRAEAIDLCLFDARGTNEVARLRMHGPDGGVFHGLLADAGPGLVYGYRAQGQYRPQDGRCFNPAKVLLDPYARAITGHFRWQAEHNGHLKGHPEADHSADPADNAATALKAQVIADPGPAPGLANRPRHRRENLFIYELHVKGYTRTMPGVPDALRGTFAGLASPAAIAHLLRLGVTTVLLLPVAYWLDERHLIDKGLSNYWGYNPIGWFCPDPRLAAAREPAAIVEEFRTMVATLHAHGIEVVLDVIFNHSAEGDERGPTLSMRGLDHASWYVLATDDRSRCENWSGCGNTLRVIHPRVTQFVLDVLRFWVGTMGVDGFRFDLATTLGRTRAGFDPAAPFFTALAQDPLLASVHWIAEPWDLGPDGYQLGRFPGRFLEWNDRYRDSVRRYWLGQGTGRGEFSQRITASADLFRHHGRAPAASVNYLAAHDGHTLADVVAYCKRHNEANGEGNRDGCAHEVCTNFGVEGPTDDPMIADTRLRVRRALLATLLLSQGTPMLAAGDEFGNSQAGNNNAYCQDNPIGWLDWWRARGEDVTIELVARLARLRAGDPLLRCARWIECNGIADEGPRLSWFHPAGHAMSVEDWQLCASGALAALLADSQDVPPRWALLFNPDPVPVTFTLPHGPWRVVLESHDPLASPAPSSVRSHTLTARALALLALAGDP